MGASSDLHIEMMNLASEWSALILRILNQNDVGRAVPQRPDEAPADEDEWTHYQHAPDLAFTPSSANDAAAVEIKMFRWRKNWLGRVSSAVGHMEQILARGPFKCGIIIFTIAISPEWMLDLNDGAGDWSRPSTRCNFGCGPGPHRSGGLRCNL